jgi:AraC-like DNA-binding protein
VKKGKDILVRFPGLLIVHHNLPGKSDHKIMLPQHVLLIPLQGEVRVRLNEADEFVLGPGRMLYLPPNTNHSFNSAPGAGERVIALIESSAWRRAKAGRFKPARLPLSTLVKEVLFYLLINSRTKNSKSLIAVLIETLVEAVSFGRGPDTEHFSGKVSDPRVRSFIEYMERHCTEPIRISQLAKRFGLSLRNLSRLMISELGVTPKQLLIDLRISAAQDLILAGNKSVTDVAFSVGYGSLSQFIAAFRQRTGQLPSEFARLGRKP